MPRYCDIEEAGTDSRAPVDAHGAARRSGTVPRAATLTPPAAPADLREALAKTPADGDTTCLTLPLLMHGWLCAN